MPAPSCHRRDGQVTNWHAVAGVCADRGYSPPRHRSTMELRRRTRQAPPFRSRIWLRSAVQFGAPSITAPVVAPAPAPRETRQLRSAPMRSAYQAPVATASFAPSLGRATKRARTRTWSEAPVMDLRTVCQQERDSRTTFLLAPWSACSHASAASAVPTHPSGNDA